jgi:hypothetical protein
MTSLWSSYWPVAQKEDKDGKITIPYDWRNYPALRPTKLVGVSAPSNTVLVKTGGNALQAVDRSALEQKNVVAVTVPCRYPFNSRAGNEMLVRLSNDQLVRTQVPLHVEPGHVFLMRIPEQTAVMGIPVDIMDNNDTPAITPSQEVSVAQSYVAPPYVAPTSTNAIPDDLLFETIETIYDPTSTAHKSLV